MIENFRGIFRNSRADYLKKKNYIRRDRSQINNGFKWPEEFPLIPYGNSAYICLRSGAVAE